jgi:N-acyl-D-amino-acid deacylase
MRGILGVVLATLITACGPSIPEPVSSITIINAVIHDGSGNDPFTGAVRFDTGTGRIIAIGDLDELAGEKVIDAGGLVLAPGFIDGHSHHDEDDESVRHMPGVLNQGVTTFARAMDGFSYRGNVADFNAAFEKNPGPVNIASFAAHNSIRGQIMRDDFQRLATADEIEAMRALVAADMEAGALGMSTGLEYEPGIYSATDEVVELSRTVADYSGIYHSHLRDEDDKFVDAALEIIRVGREAQLPVHLTHIKLADRLAWGTSGEILAMLDDARAEGIDITADIYPYERWASNIAILFPGRDYTNRADAEFTFERTANAEDILLIAHPADPLLAGKTVEDIAALRGQDVVDALLQLAQEADALRRETGEDSQIIVKSMTESDISAFMQWPFTSICSDGWHGGHPRGFGSFPRVLGRFVREKGVLTLPIAIHKMTGLPADTLGIVDRGRIVAGNYADLVLFDPATIVDHATMQQPTAVSSGIEKVWVNGQLAWDRGDSTGIFAGQVVRRPE